MVSLLQNGKLCPFITIDQQTKWRDCWEKHHFLCQSEELRVKRESINTEALNFAFNKAEGFVKNTASKVKALEIHQKNDSTLSEFFALMKNELPKKLFLTGATLSHAQFLSGRSDETGDLMNKLALINVATMKLVKEEGILGIP